MSFGLVLPEEVELVRSTDRFDEVSVPAGLLRNHRVAEGVWGRLVVHDGSLRFVFEGVPGDGVIVKAGDGVVIPPATPHRLVLTGPVSFAVEFYGAKGGRRGDRGDRSGPGPGPG